MLSRRVALGLMVAALAGGGFGYRLVYPAYGGTSLDAAEAHRMVTAGQITLVDIRRPDEWAATGSAQGAHRLDLRRDDFILALSALVNGNRAAPVALICARGVRSARLANHLTQNGFTGIINVPEGMLGASEGPGWIARGLPLATE